MTVRSNVYSYTACYVGILARNWMPIEISVSSYRGRSYRDYSDMRLLLIK